MFSNEDFGTLTRTARSDSVYWRCGDPSRTRNTAAARSIPGTRGPEVGSRTASFGRPRCVLRRDSSLRDILNLPPRTFEDHFHLFDVQNGDKMLEQQRAAFLARL